MAKTIEKLTEEDYNSAKKVIERYKIQRKEEIIEEQRNCNHEDFYRREYDEDHLITTCRKCFYEWEENFDNLKIIDHSLLTRGKYEMTEKDREKRREYIKRLNCAEDTIK